MCKETCAIIRVLEGPVSNANQIVLISGRENPDAEVSPAMDAAIRILKCVAGLNSDDPGAVATFVSSKLLVASAQAIHLIGKNGSTISSIQERSGVVLRVLPVGFFKIHGEGTKVLNAFDVVVKLLRKFLVHHGMIPVFEKMAILILLTKF
uniref:K Homology domain-containing protein n=1 Tax=Solanum lycopersicum TaxID=4081 RepID=A0A3Q7GJ97_SOLLC